MTELSPAAQAVLDAVMPLSDEDLLYTYTDKQYAGGMAAAALRAVAAQMFPINYVVIDNCQYEAPNPEREQILSIANELEAQ